MLFFVRPLFLVMTFAAESQSYASVAERNNRKRTLVTKLIALSSNVLEESKKFIKKEGGRIVVQPPEDIVQDIKNKKDCFFRCKSVKSERIENPAMNKVLLSFSK